MELGTNFVLKALRDGIRRSVESRYILVGTMNPDEGDLRPQLSDRFSHGILIRDDFNEQQRIEIVKRRIAFDDDPEKFVAGFAPSMCELADRVALARRQIAEVTVSDDQRMAVAAKGRELKLEGLRAELAVVRTARCAAALDDRLSVQESDLQEAWRLCLRHRYIDQSGVPKPPSLPQTPPLLRSATLRRQRRSRRWMRGLTQRFLGYFKHVCMTSF